MPLLCKSFNSVHKRMSLDPAGSEKQFLPGKTLVSRLSLFRLKIFEVLSAIVEAESVSSFNGRYIVDGLFNSTIQILIIWAVDMTHNSIFMAKFVHFFKLYLPGCSGIALCNSLIRTGALDYLCEAYGEWVSHGRTSEFTVSHQIIPWLKDMVLLVHDCTRGPEHKIFVEEVQHVTKWRYAYFLATTKHQGEVPSIHEYIDEEIGKRMIAADLKNSKVKGNKSEQGTASRTIGSIVKVQKAGKTLMSSLKKDKGDNSEQDAESKTDEQIKSKLQETKESGLFSVKEDVSPAKTSNFGVFKISKLRSSTPLKERDVSKSTDNLKPPNKAQTSKLTPMVVPKRDPSPAAKPLQAVQKIAASRGVSPAPIKKEASLPRLMGHQRSASSPTPVPPPALKPKAGKVQQQEFSFTPTPLKQTRSNQQPSSKQ